MKSSEALDMSHLLKASALMSAADAGRALGLKKSIIYRMCREGLLERHEMSDVGIKSVRITRRSVLAMLVKTAGYHPDDFVSVMEAIMAHMKTREIIRLNRLAVNVVKNRQQLANHRL